MTTLSDRARELGEWLRRQERSHAQFFASDKAALFKSRAETLESFLAENERLRAELSAAWRTGYDAAVGAFSSDLIACLGPDIENAVYEVVRKRVGEAAARSALNGEPAALPGSVPGQAEPESDPRLPGGLAAVFCPEGVILST